MSKLLVPIDGQFVESDALRIAEAVQEYDSNLRVQVLNDADKKGLPPFRVVERCKDGVDRIVLTADKLDQRILDRLCLIDTYRQDIQGRIEMQNRTARRAMKKKAREKIAEATDIASAIVRSPKDSYTVREGDRLIKFRS